MDDNKTKEQELVKAKFRTKNYRGTYQGATGCGKTKIAVDLVVECIKSNPEERWIIITPTENLRDNEWISEFVKWGYTEYIPLVKIMCIQTAYKLKGYSFNAVVDEVHTTLSEEYKMFYTNNDIKKLLCFTATIDDNEKLQFLNSIAPIVHITDMNKARELGIVAPYYIFNVELPLSKDSQKKYDEIIKAYTFYESQLGGRIRAFSTASYIIKTIKPIPKADRTDSQKTLLHKANMYWAMMQRRKQFLYNCEEKVQACKEILDMYPEKKALIFSKTISFATKLNENIKSCALYHSKMSKEDRKITLRMFDTNAVRIISAVDALNAGFNVPECSLAICAAGTSKWLEMVQRAGRISRKMEGKVAIFVNLYMKDTQDIKWVAARTKSINQNYVKWITNISQITF
jgi:superfamily II DNA or RNA helicase